MARDIVADFLSHLTNVRRKGEDKTAFFPVSNLIIKLVEIMKREGYIKNYRLVDSSRGKIIEIELSEYFNEANAIKPRFPVEYSELEKYEKRYLPALNFGRLILSTSKGLITNREAKEQKIGGVLIAYVY
ncbi:NEQ274 [Nanoarchaeum equitans Kin4-M]|uniref:Small ribosomal subunit protein uS8 n=1 Tax=Nanoarchaeum equitans (strain Kin4-M) TaxID=228908 RepID=RS8_NANEQ|nr:RecName: Full=Small ribosomal subunit protein uS8; AltName: Full=30S ribosomal protein S8 [Nanoarchaeum equitans Kin4-M]AAR39125.1 NEQ274 [Nanoarchaeum equitans Kin4-M]